MSHPRSARNAKSSGVVEVVIQNAKSRKRTVRHTSQTDARSEGNSVITSSKTTSQKTKGGRRVPLSSKQTAKVAEELLYSKKPPSEPVKPIAEEARPLKEFMENPDATFDISNVNVDLTTIERVTSWQARPSPPPVPASRRLPFSSSLPPSSPLPPLPQDLFFEGSEFNPPSPQQEGNFLDADVSYESNVSDDFGFFAAQSRIHAKMDREHNFNADKLGARRPRPTNEADASLEASFSGRPAFATPYLRHRPTFSSSHDTGDTTPLKQAQYENGNDRTSSPILRGQNRDGRNDDTGASKRTMTRSRGEKATLPQAKSLRNFSNKEARVPKKTLGPRAGRSKTKVAYVGVDKEGCDIGGTDPEEERDPRELSEQAKKQRIAEFEALDDYELEVEDVIVF